MGRRTAHLPQQSRRAPLRAALPQLGALVCGRQHARRAPDPRRVNIRELLRARGVVNAENARLLCFSGTGFTIGLRELSQASPAIQLIDLDRLYQGD
jgi:hypothetical protein